MKKSLSLLVGGSVIFWLITFYPALLLGGEYEVVFEAVAGVLCLFPTAATLIWCHKALKGAAQQQLLAVLGGTAVRMVFVIGAGMVLYHLFPYFHHEGFWIAVIIFYLFTLTLEMKLILAGRARTEPHGAVNDSCIPFGVD